MPIAPNVSIYGNIHQVSSGMINEGEIQEQSCNMYGTGHTNKGTKQNTQLKHLKFYRYETYLGWQTIGWCLLTRNSQRNRNVLRSNSYKHADEGRKC